MKIPALAAATVMTLISTTALADRYDDRHDRYDRDRYEQGDYRRDDVRYDRYDECARCGEVVNIDRYDRDGRSSGVGAVTGAVIGGLLGNQVGGGSGKKVATVAGAVAGGVAGTKIEKNRNDRDAYAVTVRMDDGRRVTVEQRDLDGIREGDRVYVSGGRARLI